MYPTQAEQCNHEFLTTISAWPDDTQHQPTHYSCRPDGAIVLIREYGDCRWWFDGCEWRSSQLGAGVTHKLHCTRDMWLTARGSV